MAEDNVSSGKGVGNLPTPQPADNRGNENNAGNKYEYVLIKLKYLAEVVTS